ncbi:ATP-binding SpoIIE family protein phosphatase [Streptomyces sp. NPDC006610]|uniref:ATP-binding SpoIIE family protein phosphatase n=1 Tax=Streptomyces sp. NPDC006610 TaxID=3154584 RepID=UPI0033BCCC9C
MGGDWFDAIPLSSLRTAFVIGDVVGHGLQATAAMGRLATAVQTLADLDLDPSELLARLDDLVLRLAAEQDARQAGSQDDQSAAAAGAFGATCLYAIYDPVSRQCAVASAGHPPPALLRPGETTACLLDLEPGPPLGIGGMPFETVEVEAPPGSVLAFYTDGLVSGIASDWSQGTERLVQTLNAGRSAGTPLRRLGHDVTSALASTQRRDDAALLLARTRAVSPDDICFQHLRAEESVVAEARHSVVRQLAAWGLDELAFTTEIIVSELVTNAIRHAGGPIGLRLIRSSVLVCEVTDSINTQPRMRRARSTDEGGRGLFIVAQLAQRWGSRYGPTGKIIWAEQALPVT